MEPSSKSSRKRNFIIVTIALAVAIAAALFALTERARARTLEADLKKMTDVANHQRQEAEMQKKQAEEQISILDLRIYELEIKYEMCMSKN